MPRILVLTTEPLPVPGMPASGAGLRAWGLAQGLRAAGLEVKLLMPREAAATFAPPAEIPSAPSSPPAMPKWVGVFDRTALPEVVREYDPEAIVLQHWGLARELGEVTCPLAIDLAGPHLLERRLWGSREAEADLGEKLDALRRADFLTASGRRQRLYFLPYLALAGWEINEPGILPVIPFSMQAAPEPAPARPDRLIYGGFFLPWQDPTAALETALAALEKTGRGELLFVGGPHPSLDVSGGRFEPLLIRLAEHPRVRRIEPMSFDRYQELLAAGGVALDLMARNAERELAFTTRTVVTLAAGLPVIHDNYSELGELIERAGAGWTFNPDDRAQLSALLESLLSGELDVARQARAAHELVRRELDWTQTIGPLAAFCRRPRPRAGKTAARLAFEGRDRRLARTERELATAQAELATLHGKRWVRWGLSLTRAQSWSRWPAAALAALVGLALIPIFRINDWLAKSARRH
jgi:hypothetical protein